MYYDLLPRIKNAEQAGKTSLLAPFSKMDFSIAKLLADAGYVKSAEKRTIGRRQHIEIELRYEDSKPALTGFALISRPSRHIYKKYTDLKPVRQNYGIGVLSTPRGIMTHKDAKKQKLGGEYLFDAW